jgi:hypothetical protein
MENPVMTSRVENYLAHLDRLSGGMEPRFLPVESTHEGLKGVTVIAYENLPAGLNTALTYGLSLADHPDWRYGRPASRHGRDARGVCRAWTALAVRAAGLSTGGLVGCVRR